MKEKPIKLKDFLKKATKIYCRGPREQRWDNEYCEKMFWTKKEMVEYWRANYKKNKTK